jgi:hypothetical protein
MNEITASKNELQLHFANAGIEVVSFIPERVVPPVVIINAGSTYLEPESLHNGYTMFLDLTLVAAQAVNEEATIQLDALIEQVLQNIPNFASVKQVAKPFILQANNAEYLATTINIDLSITL